MNHFESKRSTGMRQLTWVAAAAAAVALAACGDRNDGTTVGQKVDSAVQKTEQAAQNGMDKAKDATSSAGAKIEQGTSSATSSMKDAGEKVAAAVDDASITASVNAGLAKDPDLSAIRINVDTKGGVVTLAGPAPSNTARDRASEIARGVSGVQSVNNQLVVKAG